MKRKTILVGLLLLVMLMLPLSSNPISDSSIEVDEYSALNLSEYESHDPILITSDEDFEIQEWPGNGTKGNPYVIEGLEIITDSTYCVRIVSTTDFFVIRDCILTSTYQGAVAFSSVQNGRIENCSIEVYDEFPESFGVYFETSINCSIIDNEMTRYGAMYGAYMFIRLRYSTDCLVDSNKLLSTMYIAIFVEYSTRCSIINNEVDTIGIRDSTNCSVVRNSVGGSRYGLSFSSSQNITVKYNMIEFCSEFGIYLRLTNYSQISKNIIVECDVGIVTLFFDDYSYYNNITWNDFIGNNLTLQENLTLLDNFYDANYWSDYVGEDLDVDGFGDTPYMIANVTIDNRPRMVVLDITLPEINSPEDITYEYGETDNTVTWTVFDLNPSYYELYVNGSLDETGLWEESFIVIDIDGLLIGQYNYTLLVSDTSGNIDTDTVIVSVTEITTTTTTTTTDTTTTDITDTDTTTTSNGTPVSLPIELILAIGIGIGIIVIIIVAVVLIKRK